MPKHQRKVNATNVTRMRWISRETARGETARLVRVPGEVSPHKANHPISSASQLNISPARQASDEGIELDEEDLYMEDIQPLKLPISKVRRTTVIWHLSIYCDCTT